MTVNYYMDSLYMCSGKLLAFSAIYHVPTMVWYHLVHAVLGLRKLGACAAVSLGRLTLVEGGAVAEVALF